MKFHQIIQKVQDYSGFSDSESKDALELMVESLAVHLPESERKEFAAKLPEPLQDIALSVWATEENSRQDIVDQFVEQEHIDAERALAQIHAAWSALKEAISEGEINHIKAQLPKTTLAVLS